MIAGVKRKQQRENEVNEVFSEQSELNKRILKGQEKKQRI
jgi:hypothetical protein